MTRSLMGISLMAAAASVMGEVEYDRDPFRWRDERAKISTPGKRKNVKAARKQNVKRMRK